ncbi:hypothetical protein B0H13DRAFT_1855831 [Mycena leptocephala]|nr:hypothetical protein B0H13DRAFT_1855831 [Mycena leptocephala]
MLLLQSVQIDSRDALRVPQQPLTKPRCRPALPTVPEADSSLPANDAAAPTISPAGSETVITAPADDGRAPAASNEANHPAPIRVRSETPPARREDFPPLPSPGTEVMQSHAERCKNKGKEKPKPCSPSPAPSDASLGGFFDDGCTTYDEQADLQRGLVLSMGHQTDASGGASSSRRQPDPLPTSPPKRQRADTAGHAISTGATPEVPSPSRLLHHAPAPVLNGVQHVRTTTPLMEIPPRILHSASSSFSAITRPDSAAVGWSGPPQSHRHHFWWEWGTHAHRRSPPQTPRQPLQHASFRSPHWSPGQAEGTGPDPMAWLVSGLSAAQATALLEIQALASDTLTVFFFPYAPPISGFVATYYGFTIPADDDDLALAVIADAAMADPAIARFIRAHRDAFPADMTADEVLARVGESISSPTLSESLFEALRALFANLVIDTPFHGQGRIFYRPLRCSICPGSDHPTNLCPFPEYPGWLGATPATIGALLEASRDALNPRGKKSGNHAHDNTTKPNGKRNDKGKGKGNGKGKGKDRNSRN